MTVSGDEISPYIIYVGLQYMSLWGFPIMHYEGDIKHIPIFWSRRSPCHIRPPATTRDQANENAGNNR
jgi:hypothetical protein